MRGGTTSADYTTAAGESPAREAKGSVSPPLWRGFAARLEWGDEREATESRLADCRSPGAGRPRRAVGSLLWGLRRDGGYWNGLDTARNKNVPVLFSAMASGPVLARGTSRILSRG